MPLGMEVDLSPGDFVFDGDPAPPEKGGVVPPFSAHVCYGQTAAWIKVPLGTAIGLGPDDIVLDGDAAPLPKRGRSLLPNFRPMSIVGKQLDVSRWHLAWRWPWSRPHCAGWGPSCPPQKEGRAHPLPPIFGPFLLWPNGWMH